MKISTPRRHPSGFISYLLVLSTGAILTWLMIYSYQRALTAEKVQGQVQLRLDYSEKEEAILRSIVAITPNRAIKAMQSGSNVSGAARDALRWQNIFTEALIMANARTSIPTNLASSLSISALAKGNTGDAGLATVSSIFTSATAAYPNDTTYVASGLDRNYGAGYPAALSCNNSATSANDLIYPIISNFKQHGTITQSSVGLPVATYPTFNLWKYPKINFGYAKPGENFVAKRNWWAFSMNVAAHDRSVTNLASQKRDFVLSIYEVPSQLSISAASFMSLGKYDSGEVWDNDKVKIDGGIFAGKASVENSNTVLDSVSSRRSMALATGATIGTKNFAGSPFAPGGDRDAYQITQDGFFPVSLASESGRAAFIPINRGFDFFDRYSQPNDVTVLSSTSWNDYTIGARQCAMRLDVTKVVSATNPTPTRLRFDYMANQSTRATPMDIVLSTTDVVATLPAGYVRIANENQSYNLALLAGGQPVDVAYGSSGGFSFRQAVSGTIGFDNATFGDPLVGTVKGGFWRPMSPFDIKTANGQICISLYPQRLPAFLTTISAAGPGINNSIAINVDYSVSGLNNEAKYKPLNRETDYGVILKECGNLTPFTTGFSLVTNLRTFIGDDFNTTATTPPSGYTPTRTPSNPTGRFLPPCSLFTPEKRYGVDIDPFSVVVGGQIGSLASDTVANAVRPLESKTASGASLAASRINVNLSQIRHPAELPPITMMNWLIVLEERRKEFY